MNKIILVLLILIVGKSGIAENKEWRNDSRKFPPVVCYASGQIEKSFVPPMLLKSAAEKTASIEVNYISFPDSVKNAFQYAVDQWELLIESPVTIYMDARWSSLDENVLGSCGASNYYRNFEGATLLNRYYAVAAVEKMIGEEISNSSLPDMVANFNKNANWYFGTDGNCPDTLYDFVSTVMHEIGHGIGIVGFFYDNDNLGGYNGEPSIFDGYVTNILNNKLVDTSIYDDPSAEIHQYLTSSALHFHSPIFETAEHQPKLYAPRTWNDGSSIYHLDDFTYPHGNENSMMTHAGGLGEAIHNPGPITLDILADIGWKHFYIDFEPFKDVEEVTEPLIANVRITSDFDTDTSSLFLCSSIDSFQTIDSVPLVATDNPTFFSAELPVNITQGKILYFITATDIKGRTFTKPSQAPNYFATFTIGPDIIPPEINHQQIEYILSTTRSLEIIANVTDNMKVDTVWVEYLINDSPYPNVGLQNDSTSVYKGTILFNEGLLKNGDIISYRIYAKDASNSHNIKKIPHKFYYEINVEDIFEPVTGYLNDFNNQTNDFINSNFKIKTESNFIDGALHTTHPYESPEINDGTFNYSSQLKYPIILQAEADMSFDEIVLVEPGEPGTSFNDDEFWDYVIVEGSKNNGEIWLPLIDGYDSKSKSSWLVEYNNGIVGNNSTAVGTKEMFFRRGINMLQNENFAAGDTILIRFRLFSDPYANGWGWAIDNLRIQTVVANKDELTLSPGNLKIFPNPFNDKITIELNTESTINKLTINVFDIYGQLIINQKFNHHSQNIRSQINLEGYPAGMYLVQVNADNKTALSRKIIKN